MVWFSWNSISFKHKFLTFKCLTDVRLLPKLCRVDFYIVLKLNLFTPFQIDFGNVMKRYETLSDKVLTWYDMLIKKLKVQLGLLLQFYFAFRSTKHKRKRQNLDTSI